MVYQPLNPYINEQTMLALISRQFSAVEDRINIAIAAFEKKLSEHREQILSDAYSARVGLMSAAAETNANVSRLREENEVIMSNFAEVLKSFEEMKARIGSGGSSAADVEAANAARDKAAADLDAMRARFDELNAQYDEIKDNGSDADLDALKRAMDEFGAAPASTPTPAPAPAPEPAPAPGVEPAPAEPVAGQPAPDSSAPAPSLDAGPPAEPTGEPGPATDDTGNPAQPS